VDQNRLTVLGVSWRGRRDGVRPRHREFAELFWTSLLPSIAAVAILAWVASFVKWDFLTTLDFSVVWTYRAPLIQGLTNTLIITGVSVSLGLLAGFVLAIGFMTPVAPLRWLIVAYVEVLRNTPLVVQLFWIHFAVPHFTGISTTAFQSGFIAMSLQSSAYLADLARAGIQAVPKGQWEAADALGISAWAKWTGVIIPQAFKIIIPPLANIAIGYFKSSAILALLAVGELMTVASRIATYSFKPIETLSFVGLVYLALGYCFSSATYRLEAVYKKAER
jgi:His/Glu/Gln/Arg/opine family amino acid ABC transporter permease subunit